MDTMETEYSAFDQAEINAQQRQMDEDREAEIMAQAALSPFDLTGYDAWKNLVLIEISKGSDGAFRWRADVRNTRGVLVEECRGLTCYASKALCLKLAASTMGIAG